MAVVVTCDPGPWLEETLTSLGAQDYPNLSVLVIDAASAEDPTPRVAAVLPRAYVYRLPGRVGFARAANEALSIVEGASHYLFCHDDVGLAADVTRILLEEAFRSNAGVVAPKLVEWQRPDHLLSVGLSVDKTGVAARLIERGELDQEQHDSVRDVFCAPGGCYLVRADLFASLAGFDPHIDLLGENLNLCWRAQVLGARVVVAPGAHVRHLEALSSGLRPGWDDPLARRRISALDDAHRIRTMLVCYGWFHLLRVAASGPAAHRGRGPGQAVDRAAGRRRRHPERLASGHGPSAGTATGPVDAAAAAGDRRFRDPPAPGPRQRPDSQRLPRPSRAGERGPELEGRRPSLRPDLPVRAVATARSRRGASSSSSS